MSQVKELSDWLAESLKRKRVIRGGKRIRKVVTDRPGYKVDYRNGRPVEVRMSPKELRVRQKAGKRAAKKRRSRLKSIARKRKISMRKRENYYI